MNEQIVSNSLLIHVLFSMPDAITNTWLSCTSGVPKGKETEIAREEEGRRGTGGNSVPHFPLLAFSRTRIHPSSFNACYARQYPAQKGFFRLS